MSLLSPAVTSSNSALAWAIGVLAVLGILAKPLNLDHRIGEPLLRWLGHKQEPATDEQAADTAVATAAADDKLLKALADQHARIQGEREHGLPAHVARYRQFLVPDPKKDE